MILGVTNSLAEFDRVSSDENVIRGVGCHPGDAMAISTFDRAAFARRLSLTPLVGEVGLDSGSGVSSAEQRRVCANVLDLVRTTPRLLSLHSVRAHTPLLDLLQSAGVSGAILHWWTGSDAQTARAVDLGCWFSVGPGMLGRTDRLSRLPRDRVLAETDAPVRNAVAGRVDDVELAFARVWHCDLQDVRAQVWHNFAALVELTKTGGLLPPAVQTLLGALQRRR